MPSCNTATYKRLWRVLCCQCNYTAHAAKQRTRLYRHFSCGLPHFAPIIRRCIRLCCTACKVLEGIQASAAPPAHTKYHRNAGRCAGQHSRPIIIRYIIAAVRLLLWIYASPAGSRYFPRPAACYLVPGQQSGRTGSARHPPPSGEVQQRDAVGGAEPLTASAAAFFGLSPDSQ